MNVSTTIPPLDTNNASINPSSNISSLSNILEPFTNVTLLPNEENVPLPPSSKLSLSALEATAASLSIGYRKPLSRYELCARLLLDERDIILQKTTEEVNTCIQELQKGKYFM